MPDGIEEGSASNIVTPARVQAGPLWPRNHFCSFRDRKALDDWSSFQSWQRLNPQWKLRFYDDSEMESYVRQYLSDEELAGFMTLPKMAAKVDIWRLLALYNEGGLYTDLDVECLRPIEDWVQDPRSEVLLCVDNIVPNNFAQHVLLAMPRNKVIRAALDLALTRSRDDKFRQLNNFCRVVKTTGPISFTDACFEIVLGRPRKDIDMVRQEEKVDATLFREAGGPSVTVLGYEESEGQLFRHAYEEKEKIYARYRVAHWDKRPPRFVRFLRRTYRSLARFCGLSQPRA